MWRLSGTEHLFDMEPGNELVGQFLSGLKFQIGLKCIQVCTFSF